MTVQGTALIVGVGPGLGLALVREFARAGHPVAMVARDLEKLQAYREGMETAVELRGYGADAGNPEQLRSALTAAMAQLGRPEVLVYNAALLRADTPTDGDAEGWAEAMAIDLIGAKVAVEAVLPALKPTGGSMLFTGGGMAVNPSPDYASLSVGKAALCAYVYALHAQLDGSTVHATSVSINGYINAGLPQFQADQIAAAYGGLHRQPREEWRPELVIA